MSTPIKIVVTAETAQAAADLQSFVAQAGSALDQLAASGARTFAALSKSQNDFNSQFSAAFSAEAGKWTTWAQESAKSFENSWNGAQKSVSAGLTHLFEYGAQKGQWFVQMWNGMIGSMISSMTKMVVNWVMNHVIMQAASQAFHSITTALHISGEATKTAATTAGATTRIGANAAEAGAGGAASQAGIPYVGPVLAIAAMAMLVAAVMALKNFAVGGYTGAGGRLEPAGIVHRGEFVFSAPAVQRIGVGNLEAAHRGYATGGLVGSAPSGSAGSRLSVYSFHDHAAMARALERDDAHEKWVVNVMQRNSYKIQS